MIFPAAARDNPG